MNRCRDIEYVEFNRHVWKKMMPEEKAWIVGRCDERLEQYYKKDFKMLREELSQNLLTSRVGRYVVY